MSELRRAIVFSLILASCLPAGRRSEGFCLFIAGNILLEYPQKKPLEYHSLP